MSELGAFAGWLAVYVGTIIVFMLGTLPLFICVALWRRRQSQKTRQNPLTRSLLRSPGHSLREKIEELDVEVDSILTVWMMLPAITCIGHLSDSYFRGTLESVTRIIAGFVAFLVLSVFFGRGLSRRLDELRHFKLGLEGELATGQELDQLMLDGCRVFHDIPLPSGFRFLSSQHKNSRFD